MNIMSAITSAEIDSTTARVVARPTPSAPPLTPKPVATPTSVISTANTTLFDRPSPEVAQLQQLQGLHAGRPRG